jgi:hypothetical protein
VIAGHFGIAAAVKARRPDVPLSALMIASQWLDLAFVPLMLFDIEHITPAPDAFGVGYGSLFIDASYSHSLVGAALLSAVYGLLFAAHYGRGIAMVLAAVAFSHWFLDLIVHRPDMAILPGNAGDLPLLGLGLWRMPWASAALELAIVVVGFVMYRNAAIAAARSAGEEESPAARIGTAALACGVLVLAVDLFSPV